MRYQAALRPDMISTIDSKALSNFMTTPNRDFWPRGVNPFSETGFLGALYSGGLQSGKKTKGALRREVSS